MLLSLLSLLFLLPSLRLPACSSSSAIIATFARLILSQGLKSPALLDELELELAKEVGNMEGVDTVSVSCQEGLK